jgi:hypothetical protein
MILLARHDCVEHSIKADLGGLRTPWAPRTINTWLKRIARLESKEAMRSGGPGRMLDLTGGIPCDY